MDDDINGMTDAYEYSCSSYVYGRPWTNGTRVGR